MGHTHFSVVLRRSSDVIVVAAVIATGVPLDSLVAAGCSLASGGMVRVTSDGSASFDPPQPMGSYTRILHSSRSDGEGGGQGFNRMLCSAASTRAARLTDWIKVDGRSVGGQRGIKSHVPRPMALSLQPLSRSRLKRTGNGRADVAPTSSGRSHQGRPTICAHGALRFSSFVHDELAKHKSIRASDAAHDAPGRIRNLGQFWLPPASQIIRRVWYAQTGRIAFHVLCQLKRH